MLILGVNRGNHDVSACLFKDGVLLQFINAERITRKRHEGGRVWEAVRYCLDGVGAAIDDVDLVVQNSHIKDLDRFDPYIASQGVFSPDSEFIRQFRKVRTIRHHLAHACSGVALCPFDECAVLVADGIGQHLDGNHAEAESYFHFLDGNLVPIHARQGTLQADGLGFHSFDSLGGIYSMVSSYLFGHWNYCGKVMGLAPYGRDQAGRARLIRMQGPEVSVDLNFRSGLNEHGARPSDNWRTNLAASQDLAFSVQNDLEDAMVEAARWLHQRTGSKNLVIAGGVALNCVANQKILEQTAFERVFVPPPAGDDGIAIGCAFHGWLEMGGGEKRFALSHPYYGRHYDDARIASAVDRESFVAGHRPSSVEAKAARSISNGKVIGWFQGASAMGPRALGDRSILADPRDPKMRDHLNLQVKHREPFRPYGASVLEEKASEFFKTTTACPYMTFAVQVRPEQAHRIPAVVHVDGSCRIQTVNRADNPRFHRLLAEFHALTGIPLLINTSLNGSGAPIVETPEDAVRLFLNLRLDSLVLGDQWIDRRLSSKAKSLRELMEYRLVIERELEIVDRRSPDGRWAAMIRPSFPPEQAAVGVSTDTARMLRSVDDFSVLREGLRKGGLPASSRRAAAVLRDLARLHEAGSIRLIGPQSGRRTST